MNKSDMTAFLVLVVVASFLLTGCETVAGAANGAAEGAKKDYKKVEKADNWWKENMW